jgi:hypothetical protein
MPCLNNHAEFFDAPKPFAYRLTLEISSNFYMPDWVEALAVAPTGELVVSFGQDLAVFDAAEVVATRCAAG